MNKTPKKKVAVCWMRSVFVSMMVHTTHAQFKFIIVYEICIAVADVAPDLTLARELLTADDEDDDDDADSTAEAEAEADCWTDADAEDAADNGGRFADGSTVTLVDE